MKMKMKTQMKMKIKDKIWDNMSWKKKKFLYPFGAGDLNVPNFPDVSFGKLLFRIGIRVRHVNSLTSGDTSPASVFSQGKVVFNSAWLGRRHSEVSSEKHSGERAGCSG